MDSVLLLVAILAALTAPRLSLVLRLYFFTELAASIWMLRCLHLYGFQSPTYALVYTLGSLSVKAVSLYLIYLLGWRRWELIVASSFALGLGVVAFSGLSGGGDINPWIVLPEGVLFIFLGGALGFRARSSPHSSVLLALALMWILLGTFDFELLLNPTSPVWERISKMGSYWIVIAVFSWIAFSQWLNRKQPLHRLAG